MEQHTFDASSILSKLRQSRPSQFPGQDGNQFQTSSPTQPQRNRFYRKERPEVRIELENEVEHLTFEVARLRRENKQLHMEKEEMEYRCTDIKEKADATISKLRNKLVALNKKFNETNIGLISNHEKYKAKKNLEKSFAHGAGVLSISSHTPPTAPLMNHPSAASLQSLTFSQFMKRNAPDAAEEFNSSLRHYHPHAPPHASAGGVGQQQGQWHSSATGSGLHDDIMPPHPSRHMPAFDPLLQEENDNYNFHQPLSSVATTAAPALKKKKAAAPGEEDEQAGTRRPPMRSNSLAPPPRAPEDSGERDLTGAEVDEDDSGSGGSLAGRSDVDEARYSGYDDYDNDDLPVLDIDLRSA